MHSAPTGSPDKAVSRFPPFALKLFLETSEYGSWLWREKVSTATLRWRTRRIDAKDRKLPQITFRLSINWNSVRWVIASRLCTSEKQSPRGNPGFIPLFRPSFQQAERNNEHGPNTNGRGSFDKFGFPSHEMKLPIRLFCGLLQSPS